jgi:competence protein ComEC
MERWIISFFIGAILSFFSPVVPVLFYKTFILLTVLMFFYLKRYRVVLCFICGMLWTLYQGHLIQHTWQLNGIPANTVYKQPVIARVNIDSIVDLSQSNTKNQMVMFYATITSINDSPLEHPVKVRLSWKEPPLLKQGYLAQVTIKLKPTRQLANTGSFNYKAWLLTKNVISTGYIKKGQYNQILRKQTNIRQVLYDEYRQLLGGHPLSPLLLALSFGERQLFSDDHWHVLQKTGTQHLMAISGLHIGLVFALVLTALRRLLLILPLSRITKPTSSAILRKNIQPMLLLVAFFVAFGYAYLANLSIPTMRALIMLAVFITAKVVKVHLSMNRLILLCLVVIVIWQPLNLLSASFWLSFYAVLVIVFSMWRFHHVTQHKNRVYRYMISLIVLQLGLVGLMLPLNALIFGEVSVMAILANLIAVPLVSLIILPVLLLSLASLVTGLPATEFFVNTVLSIFDYLWNILNLLSSFPAASFELTVTQQFSIGLLTLLLFFLLIKPIKLKRVHWLKLAVPFVFVLSLSAVMSLKSKAWRLVVLDVGQGLSVVVVKNQKAIVYDTGAKYPSGFNMVDSVILPYIKSQRISQLDYVFISHNDNDHAGGVNELLAGIDVDILVANEAYRAAQKAKKAPKFGKKVTSPNVVQSCLSGQVWQWQSLTLTALHPQRVVGENNDDSCVLHISDGTHSVLLSGDISRKVEQQLATQSNYGQVDLVVAPHHGSKTSSSKKFIAWANPNYTVFSTGFMNRWNMPNAEVVARYQQAAVKTFNTAELGMVEFTFDQQGIELIEYRTDISPYWFAN